MLKGLYTAYTGMVNEQHRMDTLTNNLANSATVGFKKEGATSQSFDEVLAFKIKDATESPNLPKPIGNMTLGVKIGENYTDYTAGSLRNTDNPYDLAIHGEGFFGINFVNKADETSVKYTRDGSFTVSDTGYLVTTDGNEVLDYRRRNIKLDPLKSTSISQDGTIFQDGEEVTRIGVFDYEDYNYLEHYGDNMFQPVEGAKEKEGTGKVLQGYLEYSNVKVVYEMVDMIATSRQYEANQKVITTYDNSLEIAVSQLGKL